MYIQINKKFMDTTIYVLLGWIFDAFDAFLITIMITPIAEEFGLNFLEKALVIGVTLASTGLGGFFFGYLADKLGRRRALIYSILTYSVFTGLTGLVRNLWELIIVRFFAGFGIGGEWASGMALLSENVDAKYRGTAIGIVQCGWPIGVFLASLDQMFIYPTHGWRFAFYVAALPGLLLAFFGRRAPESELWERGSWRRTGSSIGIREAIFKLYRRPFFVALGMDIFAMLSYWLFWSWYITFLKVEVNLNVASSAPWLMVTQVGAFFGYIAYGVFQDRYGRRNSWTIFTILEAVLIYLFIQTAHVWKNVFILLALGFPLGFFTGYWSGFGAILSEHFPTKVRATLSGICFNTGRIVTVAGLLLQAYLIDLLGFTGILSLAAVSSVVAGSLVWLLNETRGLDLEELDSEAMEMVH